MKQLIWTTEVRKVSELIPQSDNYKTLSKHKKQKLIESLQKFNLVDLPVIDFDNTLVSGHQRLVCLLAMGRGEENIEVRFPNRKLTTQEIKEYTLIANSQFGDIDFNLLESYISEVVLDLNDFGIDFSKLEEISKEKTTSEISSEINDPSISTESKQETIELKPFKQVHVLISFSPEDMITIQHLLEKIKDYDFVEYEQIST